MAIDIEEAGNKVDKASTFFDKVNAFIKKHPWWFAFMVLFGIGYWIFNLDLEETPPASSVATPVATPIVAPVQSATPVYIHAVPETIKIPAPPVILQLHHIEHEPEVYLIDESTTVDEYGDTLWRGLYSDGVIDSVYYWELDGE
jgi:hypothetical protein